MRRSEVIAGLPVGPADFVVEIGAGPRPYAHTKLIVDKYPFDERERFAATAAVAPVVQADAAKLPIADGACDLIFMSHVIEHLEDPAAFLEEAKRCARAVYLEFPSRTRELMYSWTFHRWLVEVEDGALVFYRNDLPQLFGAFFHEGYDFALDLWSEQRFAELNNHLCVRTDALRYRISEQTAFEHVVATSDRGEARHNHRSDYGRTGVGTRPYDWRTRLKTVLWALTPASLIESARRRQQQRATADVPQLGQDVADRLRCQKCRASGLELRSSSELVCPACAHAYAARDGIFDLDL